jgi:UDP-N-acetylmuramyl-tripeptide synthetase
VNAATFLHALEGLTGISSDSRAVKPGVVFVAYPGELSDGRFYIKQAIDNGALAVLFDAAGYHWALGDAVPHLAVTNLREIYGELAAQVYQNPSTQLSVIGITGTNGKSSIAYFVAQALSCLGQPAAMIGTIGFGSVDALQATTNTTPDAAVLQSMLRDFVAQGVQAVSLEVSSHALVQGRIKGLQVAHAVFTNLTQDHLDFHGDMSNYAAAKALLFQWPGLQTAIVNADDPAHERMLQACTAKVIRYGLSYPAEVRASNITLSRQGIRATVNTPWGEMQLTTSVMGQFNVSNCLAVIAVLGVMGHPIDRISAAMSELTGVPGRLQAVTAHHPAIEPLVLVDYAHTPDALEKALQAVASINPKQHCTVVFGCGGNRDTGKRPLMAQVAATAASHIILTNDNPRLEDPAAILQDIAQGLVGSGVSYEIIPDRAHAIEQAIRRAKPQDTVLIAGKGHENYQDIGGVKSAFDDVAVARGVLEALL